MMGDASRGPTRAGALVVLVALGWVGGAATTRAQGPAQDDIDWQIGAGIGPTLLFGEACRRNDDVIDCSSLVPFLRADALVEWRALPWLWVGPMLGFGFEPGSGRGTASGTGFGITQTTEEHRNVWLLGGSAKVQTQAGAGPWAAVQLAALMIDDQEERFDGNGRPLGEHSTRSWGAAPGFAFGYDWSVTELMSLGVTASVSFVALGEAETERIHYVYDAGPAARLAFELRVLP